MPADRRSDFLVDIARELAGLPEIGDGALHRVIMAAQRKYFDPPLTSEISANRVPRARKHAMA
jgi:hypothetical protein